jgi:hypothetical protein
VVECASIDARGRGRHGVAAGGVFLVTGVVLLLMPDGDDSVSLLPTPGGGLLTVRF